MKSLISNRTWKLVDLPSSCKTIGCKWVLRKNLKPYGSIDKFKARLVAKGFKQKADLDFFDTFSPVTSITSIRLLIAITVIFYLKIHQMDVKNVFLNRDLEEEIYIGMATGWVRVRFFHIQTRPAGLLSKPEHGPINKWVFYAGPRPAPPGPMGPTQPMPF